MEKVFIHLKNAQTQKEISVSYEDIEYLEDTLIHSSFDGENLSVKATRVSFKSGRSVFVEEEPKHIIQQVMELFKDAQQQTPPGNRPG